MPIPERVRLRVAVPADVPAIFALIRALAEYENLTHELRASDEALREHLFGERRFAEALLAEIDGAAVGYALFFHTYSTFLTKPSIWLEDIFVLPEHRRAGVGRALLARLAELAVERGCGRLEWAVLDWNQPALAFYRGIGAGPVDGWTIYRLTGEALQRLGEPGASG